MLHLDHHILGLVVRRVVHVESVTDDHPGEDRQGLGGEDDEDVWEGGDEGDDPDECDESVGSLHGAHLDVMKRSTNGDVTLHCHASQVQRAVAGSAQTHISFVYDLMYKL